MILMVYYYFLFTKMHGPPKINQNFDPKMRMKFTDWFRHQTKSIIYTNCCFLSNWSFISEQNNEMFFMNSQNLLQSCHQTADEVFCCWKNDN